MTLSELKNQVNITTVMTKLGVQVDKNGKCRCPFHSDKNPSMQVSEKKQIATCFSSNCDAGTMDVLDFIGKKLSLNVHESAQWLKKEFTILEGKTIPIPLSKIDTKERIDIIAKAFVYFRNGFHLRQVNLGRDYIQGRKINIKALEMLGITLGYNSAQFHHRDRFTHSEKEDFCKVGLLSPTHKSNTGIGYTPWAPHCVIFPLKNKQAEITSLYGRSTKWNSHFYLPNRTGLFPSYPGSNTTKLILTESILDACTLLQCAFISAEYSVLALYGTNGFTGCHKEAIAGLTELEEIILFLDGDTAGQTATVKIAEEINEQFPQIYISKVNTPENEDANSLLEGHTSEVFTQLLSQRIQLYKATPKKIAKELIPQDHHILFNKPPFYFKILGQLPKSLDSLKINLHTKADHCPHTYRATVELYEDKSIRTYAKTASDLLHQDENEILPCLYELTDLLEVFRSSMELDKPTKEKTTKSMSPQQQKEALDFLKQQNLLEKLNEKLALTGIVGEENNRLFLLLIALSHITEKPLHALVQGTSGSGKTRLLKQITACMPEENVLVFTRLSEKVLYNFPEDYLSNKLIAIEDADGMGEDAEYAFRELQSGGELRSAISIKQQNGQIDAGERIVKGPVATLMCTTRGSLYEDNMGRMFAVSVDESTAQTQRIVTYQNQVAAGIINKQEETQAIDFIQNLMRMIPSFATVNPFANKVQLPKEAHKIRRLNELFHGLIKMMTLLHQHQRQKDEKGRVITTPDDIQNATDIMFSSIILKVDELDGALRDFYEQLKHYLKQNYNGQHKESTFTQREIRQHLKVSKSQLQRYILDLSELEYIAKKGGHSNRGYLYTVLYWDDFTVIKERIKKDLYLQINQLGAVKGGVKGLVKDTILMV